MKVLVIGAGVGGLATARALSLDCHQVSVFEQAPDLRTSGAAVTLWSNGTGVLDALGTPLDGIGGPIDALEQRSQSGALLFRIDTARSAARYGHPHLCLPRARLLERLAGQLPAGMIEFGRRCAEITEKDDGVQVRFEDGGTAEGDVLVGADGRNSAVRGHVWDADPAEPSGWATWQGVNPIPIEITGSRRGVMYVGKAGLCGLMPAGEGLLQWWFDVRWTPETPAPAAPVQQLRRIFAGWPAPVAAVLAAVEDADAGFFPHVRHRVPQTWGAGRVTLVGDAAHSMPPTRAQGANQALEDAWSLARALRSAAVGGAAGGAGASGKAGASAGATAAAGAGAATAAGDPVAAALRGYERTRSAKAGLVARQAGTEDTNEYRPILTRLVPNAMASRYHERWLGQISDFLAESAH
jgi:FAD-dependent urate hydroxylase